MTTKVRTDDEPDDFLKKVCSWRSWKFPDVGTDDLMIFGGLLAISTGLALKFDVPTALIVGGAISFFLGVAVAVINPLIVKCCDLRNNPHGTQRER